MIRIALAYLAIAILGILWVMGLPFEMPGGSGKVVAEAAEQNVPLANDEVTLELIVTRALEVGQSEAEIDQLINQAANQGSVRVPIMMLTTEGRVDTKVLMASMVIKTKSAVREQGDISTDETYITPDTAILDIQDMKYEVQAGDSLGALALKFYGNSAMFLPIFDANREVLASPIGIREGQVLIIPARSKL